MLNNHTFLAIIPARANSKRLPNKNILPLGDKPLIGWSIQDATQSKYIDEIIVSTDGENIQKVAKDQGANAPFLRPAKLSSDTATQIDVVIHALDYFEQEKNKKYDYIVLLQPTSPFRTTEEIDRAIELLMKKKADAVVSVTETDHHPLWTNQLPENNSLEHFMAPEIKNVRSQDLPPYFQLNGAIYICRSSKLREEKTFFLSQNIFAHKMPRRKSIDIDTKEDFLFAEFIHHKGASL